MLRSRKLAKLYPNQNLKQTLEYDDMVIATDNSQETQYSTQASDSRRKIAKNTPGILLVQIRGHKPERDIKS